MRQIIKLASYLLSHWDELFINHDIPYVILYYNIITTISIINNICLNLEFKKQIIILIWDNVTEV